MKIRAVERSHRRNRCKNESAPDSIESGLPSISPPPKAAHHHRMLRSSTGEWLHRATVEMQHYPAMIRLDPIVVPLEITSAGVEVNWRCAQAPNHADSAGCHGSRRRWAGPRPWPARRRSHRKRRNIPSERALALGETRGWRAADCPGTQTIRLIFDQPPGLAHIALVFEEAEIPTHPRVCLAMVSGWRPLVSGNCAPAV